MQTLKTFIEKTSPNLKGAFLIIAATLLTAATSALTHDLPKSISAIQILSLKSIFALLVVVLFLNKNFTRHLVTKQFSFHALKGIIATIGNVVWILSLQHLDLAQATALSLTSPFLTTLGSILIFKEQSQKTIWISLSICFSGVFIILKPGFHLQSYWIFLPLVSSLLFASSNLLVKKLSFQDSATTILCYLLLNMSVCATALASLNWAPLSFDYLGQLIVIGLLYGATQLCLIQAFFKTNISYLMPFKFARFPLSIITGLLFFAEIPSLGVLLGGGLILIVHITLICREKRISNT